MKNRVIILLSLLVVFGCGRQGNNDIKAPGIVDGTIVTLKSQVAGPVAEVRAVEGQEVGAGEVIARIDSDKLQNQLQELDITLKEIAISRQKLVNKAALVRENVGYLQKQAERFRRLKESQSLAGEKLESMELKLLEARTARFDLEKNLESLDVQKEKIENKKAYLNLVLKDHTLVSPVKGVVLESFVSAGENVFPNTAIADILDKTSLYVEVFLEGEEVSTLKINDRVAILADGLPDREFSGLITFFGQKAEFSPKYIISEKERRALLYQVKVKIDRETEWFKIGMPVTLVFKKGK
jgi:HlyD family secretion protein